MNRPLRVFLCHSSNDKPAVRELYQKLRAELWIEPWLDEEELYPGQDWDLEIQKAIIETDAIIVCISKSSTTKEGYVQKEIKKALDYSDEKPEGAVFIIPVRLEECKPPERLSKWQYADYFEGQQERGIQRLHVSLRKRAESLNLHFEKPRLSGDEIIKFLEENLEPVPSVEKNNKITLFNGMEFMHVPAGKFLMGSNDGRDNEKPQHTVEISYGYWMGRFTVTNAQFNQFKKKEFGKGRENHPVVEVTWYDAQGYIKWMNEKFISQLPKDYIFRLPSEAEWEKSARGEKGLIYPWGNKFDQNKCNSSEGGKKDTTPVGSYSPQGDSPYGCADMSGNVWEWTRSLHKSYPYIASDGREDEKSSENLSLRGDSWKFFQTGARVTGRTNNPPTTKWDHYGFRVCIAPSPDQ